MRARRNKLNILSVILLHPPFGSWSGYRPRCHVSKYNALALPVYSQDGLAACCEAVANVDVPCLIENVGNLIPRRRVVEEEIVPLANDNPMMVRHSYLVGHWISDSVVKPRKGALTHGLARFQGLNQCLCVECERRSPTGTCCLRVVEISKLCSGKVESIHGNNLAECGRLFIGGY